MTQAQREAHLRMLSTLPVRNHEGVYDDRGRGIPIETIAPGLIGTVRQMLLDKCSDRMIRRRLQMGAATLRRIKEALRRG